MMHEGHQEDAWIHTTHLICTLANSNRAPGSPPLKFNDIYPFAKKVDAEKVDDLGDIEVAKAYWQTLCRKQES